MICREYQNELTAYAEGVLEEADAKAVERHLAECANCRVEHEATRRLQTRLLAAGAALGRPGLDRKVMDQIESERVERTRRLKMMARIRMFAGGAIAAAMLISLTWAALQYGPAKAAAEEIVARGAEAASKLKSIYLKCRMRTLPGDNFQNLALDQDFVDVELWKVYGPPLKWRIEKPGRVAAMNGKQTVMLIGKKNGVKLDVAAPAAFDTAWLHQLAAVDRMLASELAATKTSGKVQDSGKEASPDQVTVDVGTNKEVGDYLKNKLLDASDTRREYTFDRDTGKLKGAKFYCREKDREVLALEIVEIKYDPAIDDSVFELEVPKDVAWYQAPQRLPDNEKYEKMTPADAARTFFDACSKKDWDEAAKFFPMPLTDERKTGLGGLEVVALGEPFQAWPYGGWFVPYEIRFPDGAVRKWNLAVRNDNPAKRFVVDGGL